MTRRMAVPMGALAVATLLTWSSHAHAQDRWSFDGRAGGAIPVGGLADFVDAGPTFGAGIAYRLNDRIAARVDGDLDILSGLEKDFRPGDGGLIQLPDINLWHYSTGIDVDLVDPGRPWDLTLNVAGGLTTIDSDNYGNTVPFANEDLSETYFTANGGVQLGYDLSPNLNVFARGQWYLMFGDEDDTADLAGLANEDAFGTVSSLPITAGLRIRI